MTIHLFNNPDFIGQKISQLISFIQPSDACLFYEDGVYFLIDEKYSQLENHPDMILYAIDDDVKARGIANQIPEQVKLISYLEWVRLTEKSKTLSWH